MKMNRILLSLAVTAIMVISFLAVLPAEALGAVDQPDLVVSIDSVTVDEYGDFTVDYTVTNQGTVWADPSTTYRLVGQPELPGTGSG